MFINQISPVGHGPAINRTTQSRVNLPPFILSRTEPKMSDEEFEQRIIEMAKRDQAAGRFHGQSLDPNSEYHSLRNSFISVASPDREGLISRALPEAMSTILSRARAWTELSFEEMVWKLLFGESPPLSSSNHGQQRLLYVFKDANGNKIAELTTGGWSMHSTPAENARSAEFAAIYNKAWDFAQGAERHGWRESEPFPSGAILKFSNGSIVMVNAADLQPQQGQAASQAVARYEANLHEAVMQEEGATQVT